MNRRNFITKANMVLGTLVLARAAGALEEVPQCPPPPPPPKVTRVIGDNHGHALMLSYEEVIISEPKTYDIKGQGNHSHQVTLGPEHFAALRKVGVIDVESSILSGHSHLIRITREKIPAVSS